MDNQSISFDRKKFEYLYNAWMHRIFLNFMLLERVARDFNKRHLNAYII